MLRIFPAALLLLGACSLSFASVDSGLLALAPAGSQLVASVNVDGSRSSAFGQFLLRQMSAQDDGFQQLAEQTGFDPRRDLQSILLTVASPHNSNGAGRFAVLARGNFDQNRIKAAAQTKGATIQQFGGVDVVVGNGSHEGAFAFPDVDLAVIGDLQSVKQVIQNRSAPTTLDPALQEQMQKRRPMMRGLPPFCRLRR